MKVKEVMTTNSLKYSNPETPLLNAVKSMKTANCGALPVIDKKKNVVGIITDRDIALSMVKKQTKSFSKLNVKEVMSPKVTTVNTEDDISCALKEMRINQVGRVPVVDENGKLKGIVSLHDLLNKSISGGKVELGDINSSEENLLKTIKAVTNRYNGKSEKTKKETVEELKNVR